MDAYLDHSATTQPSAQALLAMQQALQETWGNPSSRHSLGLRAEELVEDARTSVAKALGAKSDEILFTSGGTEANNLAVLGAVTANRRAGRRVVTSAVEHSSVDEAAKYLATQGFDVVFLPVDKFGRVSEDDLARAITPQTSLVSLMAVNNEVGTREPVEKIRRLIQAKRSGALLHVDAVQAFGKVPVRPSEIGADLLTVSSHKIHGPKGAGALYIRTGVKIQPRAFGGSQQNKLRPGTEPVPAIAGFGAAAAHLPDLPAAHAKIAWLRDYLVDSLQQLGGIVVNSPPDALPYIVNFSVLGQRSEPMLNFLSARGVYVASGSACAKGKPSRILEAMHLPKEVTDGALRVSFSHTSTQEEVDKLLWGLAEIKRSLIGT
ncbi:MAG: cysteine desulfurase [Oscillospiraceae bacterium]|jgi:cysteine desulfurase|nr:cysteine desulfurase [Oscillospiraceae bacterium]